MFKRAQQKRAQKKDSVLNIDVNDAILVRDKLKNLAKGTVISEEDEKSLQVASHLIDMLINIYGMWSNSKKKIIKLLRMMFGNKSEKSKDHNVLPKHPMVQAGPSSDNGAVSAANSSNDVINTKASEGNGPAPVPPKKRRGGSGKNSADDYSGAAEIYCKLCDHLLPGQVCPACSKHKLYEIDPKKIIRLVGNAPVTAFKFILQQTKCICGAIFTAEVGPDFKEIYEGEKYSPSALAVIIILKYLMGSTFGRLAKLQTSAGVPLPSGTQSNKIKIMALPLFQAIAKVLARLASNAAVIGFDDTTIVTLEKRETQKGGETRQGYGSAIVAHGFDDDNHQAILFNFNVDEHAGKVIFHLIAQRERETVPLLISDGLPAYDNYKKKGVDLNCNLHARRKVLEDDPGQEGYVCQSILACYREIYKNESYCREMMFNDIERMSYHIKHSSKLFDKIEAIYKIVTGISVAPLIREEMNIPNELFAEEPNSDIYKAAQYFLDRKGPLTGVLRYPGAPLDTNYIERVIKSIILIRKNSLFFHNHFSARYSADILSVLETANYADVNIFEYVEYLLAHKEEVLKNPKNYLPWLYQLDEEAKRSYWARVEEIIRTPSNFAGSANGENFHSSA